MADEMKVAKANEVYKLLCQTLEKNNWKYKKDEEKLSIECGAQGDDLPVEFIVKVDAERQLVLLTSHLPFVIQEDKRVDMAMVISVINNLLVDGCFDYSVTNGHIFFRMTNSFIESTVSESVFMYMLLCSFKTIDDYNDKLLMVAKGMITTEQFISSLAKK
ncbi:MAG: YbjN domain-containing protein [Oscillospiraceae bacterium]|nr:YbjN domain-containing protein [Oscillospiraceae bacterium]